MQSRRGTAAFQIADWRLQIGEDGATENRISLHRTSLVRADGLKHEPIPNDA
jgi:hypothetical protein